MELAVQAIGRWGCGLARRIVDCKYFVIPDGEIIWLRPFSRILQESRSCEIEGCALDFVCLWCSIRGCHAAERSSLTYLNTYHLCMCECDQCEPPCTSLIQSIASDEDTRSLACAQACYGWLEARAGLTIRRSVPASKHLGDFDQPSTCSS